MKKYIIVFLLCIYAQISFAQQWTLYDYTNSGLPNDYVKDIAIDLSGNKWFATYLGIVKWDGTNWTTFNESNSGLQHNICYTVAVDTNNNIWIGSANGFLTKFDGISNWTYYPPYDYVTNITINKSNNDIWICRWQKGVARYDGTSFTVYDTLNSGLPHNNINEIAIENDSTIWFANSYKGLIKLSNDIWTIYDTSNSSLPSNVVFDILISHDNKKYIGTNLGMVVYDTSNWTILDTSNSSIPSNDIRFIIESEDSSIWTSGDKLIKYKDNTWTFWDASNSPLGSSKNMVEDSNNNIFVISDNKVYKLDLSNEVPKVIIKSNTIKAYPNPFTYETTFISDLDQILEIKIFDISGKLLKTIKGNNTRIITIKKDGLSPGCYISKVIYKNTISQSNIKLIIN